MLIKIGYHLKNTLKLILKIDISEKLYELIINNGVGMNEYVGGKRRWVVKYKDFDLVSSNESIYTDTIKWLIYKNNKFIGEYISYIS